MKEGYLPKEQRKKILLLCDDIRMHSGVATMAREFVLGTCHRYNWVNAGAAINHPEEGNILDLSEDLNAHLGIKDSNVKVIPSNGYGDPTKIRNLMAQFKPDAIFIITDPRYWTWLFQIENELRKQCPIVYLNIWDDYPSPLYNKAFYESCDALFGISKQTVNINKLVLGEKADKKIIEYVPHGLNSEHFFPIDESYAKYNEFLSFKKQLFKGQEFDYVVHFNSRNIRRKQIPDTIWAYKQFVDKLPLEKAKKCALLLHTQPIDNNGTDLPAVAEALCGDSLGERYNIIFDTNKWDQEKMGWLYNATDVQILLTSNEGWGLTITEAILCGNPIIANVTGGMQDQMRFEDEYGKWIEFNDEFPSNHRGTYKKCGPWAFPVFPTNISIQGSVPTPYIFDDRCSADDAAEQIMNVYNLGKENRKERGKVGRNWALGDEAGFTSEKMCYRIISYLDKLFDTWSPREKYELIKIETPQPKVVRHLINNY